MCSPLMTGEFRSYRSLFTVHSSNNMYLYPLLPSSYGDGICCNYGNGNLKVTHDGNEVASGGSFGSFWTSEAFGLCDDGQAYPTSSPTRILDHVATYNPTLLVASCSEIGTSCTTGDTLINDKANGESNTPNSLDSCTDGTNGE